MDLVLQYADTSLWLHVMTPINFNPVLKKNLLWWSNRSTEGKINIVFLLHRAKAIPTQHSNHHERSSYSSSPIYRHWNSPWEVVTTHWMSGPITESLDSLRLLKSLFSKFQSSYFSCLLLGDNRFFARLRKQSALLPDPHTLSRITQLRVHPERYG